MKTILTIVTLIATCAGLLAQEFNPKEIQFDIFGQVETMDLDSEDTSYGFGVSYFIGQSLGFGARTSFNELSGHLFESISPRLLWRVPIGDSKHALYGFAQATRTFHGNTGWSGSAGPGYEYRLFKHVGLYAEIGMRKQLTGPNRSTDTYGTGEFGLRFNF